MKHYKVLSIHIHDAETQTYVCEAHVTTQQILSGDDSGVVCLCLMPEMAPVIAGRLNVHCLEQETVGQEAHP